MQVPGAVGLGPQHRVQPLRGQRLHDAVVECADGVDHRGQRVFRGYTGQYLSQPGTVRYVTDCCVDPGAQLAEFIELVEQSLVGSGAAQQQEMTCTTFGHQVAGEAACQDAGTACDQDRAIRIPHLFRFGLSNVHTGQSWHFEPAIADAQPWLVQADGAGQLVRGEAVVVAFHQDEAAGVFRLG
ncbi:hypothetical protein GCM10022420_038810 [Streptomyces iranensis]